MGIPSTIAGTTIGIKLINGKIKPKYGKSAIIVLIALIILFVSCFVIIISGIINNNIELIIAAVFGVFGLGYILLVNPYFQRSSNYYIEFKDENTLSGFKLFYKGKPVTIQYAIDNNGKIAFMNNNSKLSCISYADGTHMNNMTKYKIINYFMKWLNDNDLLSKDTTVTFEK